MKQFILDPSLARDCHILSESEYFIILLMDNALVPWFILVPKTEYSELYQLDNQLQSKVLDQITQLSKFVKQHFQVDKLNIAALGNIVEQLHIHVVGRYKSDVYWPKMVWGTTEKKSYDELSINNIQIALNEILVL
jgi:diadenosine tetraphosphate (Ap4A) HIT family hydrolase